MFWELLWDKNQKTMIWKGLLVKGKFIKNNKGNPTCPKCKNSVWHPFFFGSFDVEPRLAYRCDCLESVIEFKEKEDNNNEIY